MTVARFTVALSPNDLCIHSSSTKDLKQNKSFIGIATEMKRAYIPIEAENIPKFS